MMYVCFCERKKRWYTEVKVKVKVKKREALDNDDDDEEERKIWNEGQLQSRV